MIKAGEVFDSFKEVFLYWVNICTTFLFSVLSIINFIFPDFRNEEIEQIWRFIILLIGFILSSSIVISRKNKEINILRGGKECPDRILFKKITENILPKKETVYFLKHHNFGSSYRYSYKQSIDKFIDLCENRPDFYFRDKKVEETKNELKESLKKLSAEMCHECFCDNMDDICKIPKKKDDKGLINYRKVVERLNGLSLNAADKYQNFLKVGSDKLSIPFDE